MAERTPNDALTITVMIRGGPSP